MLVDGRPGVRPHTAPPPAETRALLPGRYLDRVTAASVDLDLMPDGTPTGSTHGMPFRLRAAADGRLMASRSAEDFHVALSADGNTLDVELDAGVTATYHRVAPGATLPDGLPGRYASPDMDAVWTIAAGEGGMAVRVDGPLVRTAGWEIEPVQGDCIRIYTPTALYRGWLDVRVVRDPDGGVAALRVDGGRARNIVFTRIA